MSTFRLCRRRLLRAGAGLVVAGSGFTVLGGLTPPPDIEDADGDDRWLDLYRIHSRKSLSVRYFLDGDYDDKALAKIDTICRDNLQKEETVMDIELVDNLWMIKDVFGRRAVVDIISAYRTPKTNAFLRSKSKNVSKKSQHMKGEAIDIRIRGVPAEQLADAAHDLRLGGVGFYRRSQFVHLDVGRPRRWNVMD